MKYLFIDTNIYKYLFNDNSTFSDDVVVLIKKLIHAKNLSLILPRQVIDEVERNYLENWYVSEYEEKEKTKKNFIEALENKIKILNEYPKLKRSLEKEKNNYIKVHKKDLKKITIKYRDQTKSGSIKNFNNLKESSQIIETDGILQKAVVRDYKNNPPYDKSKITDAIIWESILSFFEDKNQKSTLYFLSDDSCYGKQGFNPFLKNEIGKFKVKIEYRKSITSLKDLLGSDIDKIVEQEKEELKKNAILNFINSRNFASAGNYFTELLNFKDNLKLEDFKNIIKASIINYQIYGSFFVNMSELLEDRDAKGFTVTMIDEIDESIWKAFKEKNLVLLNRRKDSVVTPQNTI